MAFALRTVLKGRTRGDGQSKSFIKFSNKVSRTKRDWITIRSERDRSLYQSNQCEGDTDD